MNASNISFETDHCHKFMSKKIFLNENKQYEELAQTFSHILLFLTRTYSKIVNLSLDYNKIPFKSGNCTLTEGKP